MSKIDDIFNEIVSDEKKQGPARLRVIDTPTSQQLLAIPAGSDVIISDDSNFMAGVWSESIATDLCGQVERGGCPHLHAYLAYLPPAPVPDSSLSAEEIATHILSELGIADEDERRRIEIALQRAVHMAREGMVFTPF